MAYSTGKNQTLTFAGSAIPCIQSVETSESVDVVVLECAGSTTKTKIMGLTDATMTVNYTVETNGTAGLGYLDPNDVGAVVWRPFGATAGNVSISSTNGTVSNRTMSAAINGFFAVSVTIQLDDLTIGTV